MHKQAISCPEAPAAIGPYSQAIQVGDWLFVSGQIPLDAKSGQLVAGAIAAQTTQALENLATILRSVGLGLEQVVNTTVYLADLADFAEFNRVYAQYFAEAPPARATVQVAGLPKGARIEIAAIAVK